MGLISSRKEPSPSPVDAWLESTLAEPQEDPNTPARPRRNFSSTSMDSFSSSSLDPRDDPFAASINQHHQYVSGRFSNSGIFKPSGSARYNFLVQKMKHRKHLKNTEAWNMDTESAIADKAERSPSRSRDRAASNESAMSYNARPSR